MKFPVDAPKEKVLRTLRALGFTMVREREWSEWDERHGRQRREGSGRGSGSCRDTTHLDGATKSGRNSHSVNDAQSSDA
jgi:hypothetical protein